MRKTPGQLERGANLGRGMGRVVFQDLDGSDHMPEALEVAQEPGPEQVLGAGSAAPSAVAGIVWNKQKLNIHETNPSSVRRLTPLRFSCRRNACAFRILRSPVRHRRTAPGGAQGAPRPQAATAG